MRPVRSMEERFWSKVNKDGPTREGPEYEGIGPCWVFCGSPSISYERAHLLRERGQPHRILASRYSWILHNGPIPDETPVVRHRCDNGHLPCVNPAHLLLGTHLDNVEDYYRRRSRHGYMTADSIVAARIANVQYGVPVDILARIACVRRGSMDTAIASGGSAHEPIRRRKPPLTDAEVNVAVEAIRSGLSVLAAARKVGRSWGVVNAALESRGIDAASGYRRMTDAEVDHALALLAEGKTMNQTAKEVGFPWRTVVNTLRRRGVLPDGVVRRYDPAGRSR